MPLHTMTVPGAIHSNGMPMITTINGVTYTVKLSRGDDALADFHRVSSVWEKYGFTGDLPVRLIRGSSVNTHELIATEGWSLEYVDRYVWCGWYNWLQAEGRMEEALDARQRNQRVSPIRRAAC